MNKIKKDNNLWKFFIIFLTSFLLWVIFSFNIGNIIEKDLLKTIEKTTIINKIETSGLDMDKFWEVYSLIKNNNYDSSGINKEELVDSAIKWLVDWLWDKHSEYLSVSETQKFNEVLSWDFEWIWAVVEKNEIWVLIDRIIKWSPSKKYWLKSWDIIIKANNVELEELSLYDAVDVIKWKAGTKVLLEILRPGEVNILTIEVIREKIKIPSVESKIFEEQNFWYIAINMFWEDTSVEFKKALDEVMDTDWLIIDLRDNWWGYLQSAVEILSNLVEEDKILVVTKYKDLFSNVSYPSINDGTIYDWKIVVLINENSASASEITAGALKDYKKAILVWKKSYWKWSVQKPFNLSDGSMVKLTIAKWFTPNDVNIDHEWINPDIEIDFIEEDFENLYDRQLEEAKDVLKVFIEKDAYKLSIDSYNETKDEENK